MALEEPDGYVDSWVLIGWAAANLKIMKLQEEFTDDDIKEVIHWIGMCAVDTILVDGTEPIFGRIGIELMLMVTLLEFPRYFEKFELWQRN